MNMNIGDLLKKLLLRDPLVLGGAAVAVLGVLLFGVTASAFLRGNVERRALADEYESVSGSLGQIEEVQGTGLQQLRENVETARTQLQALLAAMPTESQATETLARYYDYAWQNSTQLVRLETSGSQTGGAEGQQPMYGLERFILEARGHVPHLLHFLIVAASESPQSFAFENITIGPDGPAVARADLTILYSVYTPVPTPSAPPAGAEATPAASTPAAVPTVTPAGPAAAAGSGPGQ